ncbi:DUF423-domain-containing protein [Podospora didyma]|uniref:DUF423-domain-containing protein n=1 Tax=Podospora didyma TaxID=330526 RepID=A0AAE0K0Q3_9PEZI|nr:DUF423-domain-containing protein [Podospora didyma]
MPMPRTQDPWPSNTQATAPPSPTAVDQTTPLLPRRRRNGSPTNPPQTQTRAEKMSTLFWKVGAISGAVAVAFGAFGAHGLKKRIADPAKIANWGTAAHYQLIHSVAILIAHNNPLAAGLFTAGSVFFSGSIYALTLDTERFRFLGPVTPLGGLLLIAGWLALAFSKGGPPPRWPRF